jgi:hypothetical protein
MSAQTTPGAGETALLRAKEKPAEATAHRTASAGAQDAAAGGACAAASAAGARANVIGPIIAGARARGVADAFELLGEAAILLDFSGAVLHVGASARPLIGCAVSIVSDHLAPASARSRSALQGLLEAGLAEGAAARLEADLPCAESGMRQRVRLYRVDDAGDPRQLLRSVLTLEPPRRLRNAMARGARERKEPARKSAARDQAA